MLLPQNSFATNSHSTDLEDGSSQYWSILDGSQTGLDLAGNFTFETWVKLESTSGVDYFLSKFRDDNNNASYRVYYDGTTINLSISSNGSAWTTKSVTQTIGIGAWHHIAVSYNATAGEAKFYYDGSQTGTTQTGLPNSIFNGSATFSIGANIADVVGGYADGLFDETRLWSSIRTDTEISTNYNCALTGGETGLVSYWKFDNNGEDTNSTNDLTNNNSATFSTDVNFTNDCGSSGTPSTNYWVNYQIMSTTTDMILGNVLEWSFMLMVLAVFLIIANIFFKITKR